MPEAAVRDCWVKKDGGEPEPLRIAFTIATQRPDGDYEASATISCKYFDRVLTLWGPDAVQPLFNLPMVTHAFLQGREDHGYEIYHYDPGDLHNLNFWGRRISPLRLGGQIDAQFAGRTGLSLLIANRPKISRRTSRR